MAISNSFITLSVYYKSYGNTTYVAMHIRTYYHINNQLVTQLYNTDLYNANCLPTYVYIHSLSYIHKVRSYKI